MLARVAKRKTCCFWVTKSFFLIVLIALPYIAKAFFIADTEVFEIYDYFQIGLKPVNQFLHKHQTFTKVLIVISGLMIDLFFIISWTVWLIKGNSSRPVLAWLFVLFVQFLAQICGWFAPSQHIYWKFPGFPSLLLNYHPTTAVFFSTDISFLTIANFQLAHKGNKWGLIAGIIIQIFISFIFLITNRHYYVGILFGFVTAHLCLIIARKFSDQIDKLCGRLKKQSRSSEIMELNNKGLSQALQQSEISHRNQKRQQKNQLSEQQQQHSQKI